MKKLLAVPLLLTILLVGGCSLTGGQSNDQQIKAVSEALLEQETKTKVIPEEIMFGNRNEPAATCTMDAQICPDGSAVGRVAPDCQFAPCP